MSDKVVRGRFGGNAPTARPALADGGGPPHDGGMEARVAKLESTTEHILQVLVDMKQDIRDLRNDAKVDFRILFGATITATLGLGAIMAKGFGWF